MYSDSAVADIVCPFEIGRLGEPVEISWNFAGSEGDRVGPITNASSRAYWLEEEDNRTLHINISTLGPLGYQCAGSVEICEHCTSCRQSPPSPSPAFVVLPIGKLCMNLYTCVQIFSRYYVFLPWPGSSNNNYNTFFNIQISIVSVSHSATSNLAVICNVMQDI